MKEIFQRRARRSQRRYTWWLNERKRPRRPSWGGSKREGMCNCWQETTGRCEDCEKWMRHKAGEESLNEDFRILLDDFMGR